MVAIRKKKLTATAVKVAARDAAYRNKFGGAQEGAGRPSTYTKEIGERICLELINGKSMIKICEVEGMPDRATVVRWLWEGKHQEFAAMYSRARDAQADYMDDKILQTADDTDSEKAAGDRVRIQAYQWRAARLRPKTYGDRVHKEVTGADGGPVKVNVNGMTDAQLDAIETALSGATDTSGRAVDNGKAGEGEEEN